MFKKPTAEMTRAELEIQEIFELVREIKQELQDIRFIIGDLSSKAQISHCLLVVRKISEDKLEELDKLID